MDTQVSLTGMIRIPPEASPPKATVYPHPLNVDGLPAVNVYVDSDPLGVALVFRSVGQARLWLATVAAELDQADNVRHLGPVA